jgi:hypothetical protein
VQDSRDCDQIHEEMKMANGNDKLSENAGFGNRNPTSESAVDVEREPMPDRSPDTDSNSPDAPPARSGSVSERREDPTEAGSADNPVHHTGHVPPLVTANRE